MEAALGVERIGKTYPQVYPQKSPLSRPFYILDGVQNPSHMWGRGWTDMFTQPGTSPQ